jgi:hypothetical protein
MDHNVTRTHTSLALVVALLDQLRTKGTLTDQDLDDILAMHRPWCARSTRASTITRISRKASRLFARRWAEVVQGGARGVKRRAAAINPPLGFLQPTTGPPPPTPVKNQSTMWNPSAEGPLPPGEISSDVGAQMSKETMSVHCPVCNVSSPRDLSELARPSGQTCLICGMFFSDYAWILLASQQLGVPASNHFRTRR